MTQRHNTQPLPVLAGQSSAGLTFIGAAVPQSRPHLRHIPPPPERKRFPEAEPRTWQTAVLCALAVILAVIWFVRTPAAPEAQPIAMSRGP